jgi:hypothetical protein
MEKGENLPTGPTSSLLAKLARGPLPLLLPMHGHAPAFTLSSVGRPLAVVGGGSTD